MISAARTFDRQLVRAFIDHHGLDPVPNRETESLAWQGLLLTVEGYSWGRACFAEWRARDVGVTWVEYGERPELPDWAERIRTIIDRPNCLGYHENDHICDGGKNPDTGTKEPPCRWRAVCLYVQQLAKKPAAVPSVLEHTDNLTLWERAAAVIEAPSAIPKPKRADGGPRLRGATRPERQEERRRRNEENLVASRRLVDQIVARIMELGGWVLNPNRWRTTIGQYTLVEHPRSDRSPLYVLFTRRPQSWAREILHDITTEQGICRFLPQSSNVLVTVQIRTQALDLVRGRCPTLRVHHVQIEPSSSPKSRQRQATHLVSVVGVSQDEVDDVAGAIVEVINGGLLWSWGAGAFDRDHPLMQRGQSNE